MNEITNMTNLLGHTTIKSLICGKDFNDSYLTCEFKSDLNVITKYKLFFLLTADIRVNREGKYECNKLDLFDVIFYELIKLLKIGIFNDSFNVDDIIIMRTMYSDDKILDSLLKLNNDYISSNEVMRYDKEEIIQTFSFIENNEIEVCYLLVKLADQIIEANIAYRVVATDIRTRITRSRKLKLGLRYVSNFYDLTLRRSDNNG